MADSDTFDLGDRPRLEAAFSDAATGEALDPGTVTFRIKEPDGAITQYVFGTNPELVRAAAGTYYVDWPAAKNGTHFWRFESTGAGQAAGEASFTVKASNVA